MYIDLQENEVLPLLHGVLQLLKAVYANYGRQTCSSSV